MESQSYCDGSCHSTAQPVAREADGTLTLMSASTTTYEVGDLAQGGVVCWVDATGEHGLVVTPFEIEDVAWSNITNVAIGNTSLEGNVGAGKTLAIILQPGHTHSAASLCAGLAYGGYDDWYLPSKSEWNRLSPNLMAITDALDASGILYDAFLPGNMSSAYWTADEISATTADTFSFLGGVFTAKSTKLAVRAFRSF